MTGKCAGFISEVTPYILPDVLANPDLAVYTAANRPDHHPVKDQQPEVPFFQDVKVASAETG